MNDLHQRALELLVTHGLLLVSDGKLPSVASLVAGKPVAGSWWGHPRGDAIFDVASCLARHPDALVVKLVARKVTYVHRTLWPAVLSIGMAREKWQLDGLTRSARSLFHLVTRREDVRTHELPASAALTSPGEPARALEQALLVHGEQVHTESGAHAKRLRSWRRWARDMKWDGRKLPPARAKALLEERVAALNEAFGGHATLPWMSLATKQAAIRTPRPRSTAMRKASLKTRLILMLGLGLIPPAYGQTHLGSIRGTVTDVAKHPLSGFDIALVYKPTNETRSATSGAEGQFTLSSLPPGSYRLEIGLAGYKKHVHEIELQVNQERRVDVALEVGTLSEQVIVYAPLATTDRDSAALGALIDNRQVAGLPLDGRNFLELSLLAPGTASAAPGSAGSVRGDFAFNANGAREDANNFLLDGVYNGDPKLNTFGVKPPVDAIQEFEILTSSYDASFGRNAGAQVNVVLKSGGNQPGGTVYEFIRTGALDARNFFAPRDEPAPAYQRNQFGFSLGGPLVKDRAFFFADYEGTRVREGITRVTNVPTARERAGDFSQSLFRQPVDPFTQQPFPGGVIPPARVSPIGRAIAALYPLPNRSVPLQNHVSSPSLRDRNDHFDVRLDHPLGTASDLMIRFSFGDRTLFEPFSGAGFAAVPGFGTRIPRRAQNLAVGDTRVVSPAVVNEVRFGFSRVALGAFQENQGRSLNRTVGLPELSANPRDSGLSFITISGFSQLGDEFNNPQESVTNTWQLLDTLTYAAGRHLVKLGGEGRVVRQRAFRDVQARGFLTFSDQAPITGNALADLLIGFPILTGGARLDNPQNLRTESYGLFVQDSYRLGPALTLTAGLRYEYTSPPVDAEDRATLYDPQTRSLARVGSSGVPRGGYKPDRDNWAPRVGIAWAPLADSQTVLRAGYGLYYDQSALAPGEGLYFSPPFFDLNLFFPLPGLPLTLNDPFPSFFPIPLPDAALAFQRDLKTPSLQHWNVNVQQELGSSRVLEVGYAGSKGTSLLAGRDINQPRPSPLPFNPRPVPEFDSITLLESRATSTYKSLQLRFQQRLDRGLSFLSAYTLAKSTDDASSFFASAGDPNFPQDSFDLRAERGRSNFDVRHRFSLSVSYDVPIGPGRRFLADGGWLPDLLAGWQVNAIVTLQSGRPFTVALLPEIDNSNTGRAPLGFGANDRPDLAGDPELSSRGPNRWFNTAAFTIPPRGNFGNAGRNIIDGPGYQNVNLGILKNVALGERVRLQLRAEAFNLLNRANFDLPDNFLGSPTFGRILSAQSPRHIQFGVKLLF